MLSGTDLIAEGRIKPRASPAPKSEVGEIAEASEWPFGPSETIGADAFYRDVARTGIDYGPCFQMVEKASVDGKTAFMRCASFAVQNI